jgi:hypothetical protein
VSISSFPLGWLSKIPLGLKLIKYVAKLRLLEHGMLDAASTMDDFHITSNGKEHKLGVDTETESLEEFEQRVQVFVQLTLLRASGSRGNYKHGHVFQARKDLIQEVLKASLLKKCPNPGCGA